MLTAFSAILYTSCHKDPCSGVNCLNGGSCSNGSCLCPSGFTGLRCENLATTTITYNNNTFTPVSISINGVAASIPAGGSVFYSGLYGDAAVGTASTNVQFGLILSWDLSDLFPPNGTSVVNINVSSTHFFLFITNNSVYTIGQVYVNYGLTTQTYDAVNIPHDDYNYSIGYYDAYTNSNLYLLTPGGGHFWSYNISLSFTENQSYTFTAY